MLYARHLEVDEFMNSLMKNPRSVIAQVVFLDCGVAGIVYGYHDEKEDQFCYLDRIYPTAQKAMEIEKISFYDLHKELYMKINLKLRAASEFFNQKNQKLCFF